LAEAEEAPVNSRMTFIANDGMSRQSTSWFIPIIIARSRWMYCKK